MPLGITLHALCPKRNSCKLRARYTRWNAKPTNNPQMGGTCCTGWSAIRHFDSREERLLGDEQLSIKAIRFAVYRVCKETCVDHFPKRWDAVVEAFAGHHMDLTFRPEYTINNYILLFKSSLQVHNLLKIPTDVFDFL
jgi:hypothetical protein